MASDENNWFFDVVYSKRVKNQKFVKSLNFYYIEVVLDLPGPGAISIFGLEQ